MESRNRYFFPVCIGILFSLAIGCSKQEPFSSNCKSEPQLIYCTKEYVPVCGCDNTTYGNACEAEAAGVNYWEPGKCQ